MRHERLDARRRPAVREPGDESSGDGGADNGSADDGAPDPDRVRRRIRDRAERIERREVGEAISSLEARGGLTDEQRETVRLLGTAIARGLTAAPESALERPARDEPATVRAVARLFDVERE
ncbi:glutamyl-tRNA reductase [Halorubrum depositum]|uniref:glutamyl-tRNA reductase n=1 Tax=Halorubrum depositum TaxID=2583992 RepID=UPI00164348C3|nr:glutamyl-tRNA reductase [Halorubrum depositum]